MQHLTRNESNKTDINYCSFCYKKTNQLVEFPKGPRLCWYCIDIIQKWETYEYNFKKKTKKEADQA